MPYTKSDYPASMKNLNQTVRLKAIDIVNAMLEEGYEESQAIPIAINQAKEWADDASEEEKEKLKKKDITKHSAKDQSDSARLQHADVRVWHVEAKEKWAVKSEGAKQVDSYHSTKKEAVNKAKEIADNRETKVIQEKKN